MIALLGVPRVAHAQTDYYNTDSGRPITIEDAYPVERYGFELQLAPVRLERSSGGSYGWQFEPELAYGIFPRTQLEIGLPIHVTDGVPGRNERGLAGIEISALHNLNVETAGLPALGVAIEGLLPVGSLAPDDPYASLKGIATRTYRFARIHLNGRWTWGAEPRETHHVPGASSSEITPMHPLSHHADSRSDELSRWLVGAAIDKTFPLKASLVTASAYVEQPLERADDLRWVTEAGLRYQWSPRLAVDAGVAKKLTGDDRPWSVTFGAAYAFAIRSLMDR
ncbi:MAG: hypothetical protein EXR95_04485 [Gemmatimonadetes bacterium]|nr:hypothetical protein [Gemmatimonadota bacterium]